MVYETEIAEQEGIISQLQNQIRQTKLPARTINWQHNNIGSSQGITQRILVVRKQRKQINARAVVARNKIVSLREAILGVE